MVMMMMIIISSIIILHPSRAKPCVIQSFVTFDSTDRTIKYACFFSFIQFVILKNLSILYSALSEVKGLIKHGVRSYNQRLPFGINAPSNNSLPKVT